MTERTTRRVNTDALVELCDRLDMQAALLEIIEGERIDVDLYLKASAGLREALAEIERLRSDAATLPKVLAENERLRSDVGLHLKTATELREARIEIEHLQSDKDAPSERSEATAELRGMNISTFWPTDWFLKLLSPYNAKNGLK